MTNPEPTPQPTAGRHSGRAAEPQPRRTSRRRTVESERDVAAGTVTDTGSDPDDTDADTAEDDDDDTESDTGAAVESDGDDTVLARTGVSTPLPLLIPIILMMAFGVTPVRRRHHV